MSKSNKKLYFSLVPPQEILPVINKNYESKIKGLYVIGDVTGIPLVKIAANQGVEVITKMFNKGVFKKGDKKEDVLDIVIVGSGPAGLSASLEAVKKNLKCLVLERTFLASTIHGFPPGKKVYSEPRFLKNKSDLPAEGDLEKTVFIEKLEKLVKTRGVEIEEGKDVVKVKKIREHYFKVEALDGSTYYSSNVIIAVGRQGQPRRLGVPGEELSEKVRYRFHTPEDYSNNRILIVGGGNSAVEAALMLCDHNSITISYRKNAFFRLKEDNKRLLDEAISQGRITLLLESNVKAIREKEIDIEIKGELSQISNEHVLILIGSSPPIDFLLRTGLELEGIWTFKHFLGVVLGILIGYFIYFQSKHFDFLLNNVEGIKHVPGFSWLFKIVPAYFSNLYAFYYLIYFSLIAVLGIYWASKMKHKVIWRRNLILIGIQWGIWWGVPVFLAAIIGRNAFTPILQKLLNAWPLNMEAFRIAPFPSQGDPGWWYWIAILGVLWAIALTFVILPVFTLLVGKHYCSHVCSCGALAETVGNAFRHKSPKGDVSRFLERYGFVFIPVAAIATISATYGFKVFFNKYNIFVGTFLAGALAIGLYPFLGQRIWCRYFCPLAFWMNFWGRWSRYKISPEPGKCIDCNICNRYCQMGIDIRTRALQGKPVTLKDTPCVACGECIARCPMEILHFGDLPPGKPYCEGTDAGEGKTKSLIIHNSTDVPQLNELSIKDRTEGVSNHVIK